MAESATFALKAGVWFRRGRLLMVSPDSRGIACPPSGRNSTYRSVQISETGSGRALQLSRKERVGKLQALLALLSRRSEIDGQPANGESGSHKRLKPPGQTSWRSHVVRARVHCLTLARLAASSLMPSIPPFDDQLMRLRNRAHFDDNHLDEIR